MNNYWVFTFNKNIHKYHILISGKYPYSELYGDVSVCFRSRKVYDDIQMKNKMATNFNNDVYKAHLVTRVS